MPLPETPPPLLLLLLPLLPPPLLPPPPPPPTAAPTQSRPGEADADAADAAAAIDIALETIAAVDRPAGYGSGSARPAAGSARLAER